MQRMNKVCVISIHNMNTLLGSYVGRWYYLCAKYRGKILIFFLQPKYLTNWALILKEHEEEW